VRFQTGKGRYAYDGNTGAILKLDRITNELLDFIGTNPRGEVPASLTTQFSTDEVARSLSRLEALLKKSGVFRPVAIKSRLIAPEFVVQNWRRIAGNFDHLVLEVTQDCNMRCLYCVYSGKFVNVRTHNHLAMTWDTARRAIDFFLRSPSHQAPCQNIGFYGGEPLINSPLIMRCVEYVRSRDPGVTFSMATNGTLFDERILHFLVANEFQLFVSLDGPGEIHDQNRMFAGGKGSFETIVRNLRAMKESAPEYYAKKVRFQCVVSPGVNFRNLRDFFVNTSDLIGVATPRVQIEIPGNKTCYAPSLLAEFHSGLEALEEAFLHKVVKGDRNDGEFAFLRALFEAPYLFIHRRLVNPNGWGETFHTMATCFPGHFRLFVGADGKLFVCEKGNNALEIGDIERGLDGEKINEIYRAYHDLHQKECRRCWALRLCAPCYASDTKQTGTFRTCLDPQECQAQRRFWTDKLRKYASVQEQNASAFEYLSEVVWFRARIPMIDFVASETNNRPEVH
jgi:uncharacterized protein